MDPARILIADDDPHIARALSYVLGREGMEVRSAPDGRAALEMAREFLPEVILLDIMMPRLDGMGFLAQIRADEKLRGAGVILLTAAARSSDIVSGLEHGADDYVKKPFDPNEVLARVRAQLRVRRLQARLVEAERWRVLLETAGAVTHEMSQPLTAVMGNIELLLRRIPAGDPLHAPLKRIHENGERAVQLLRKLQHIESYETKEYPGSAGILDIDRSSRS